MAPSVWLRASCACIRSCRRASSMARTRPKARRASPAARGLEQRPAAARQQRGFHARRGQPFHQPERLPLAAAHFLSGIEVQDAHQLMFLALEYFRKV
jgi:hypothetical protein